VQQPVQPRPAPPPPPAPLAVDWTLLPLTGGSWVYSVAADRTQAMFGPPAGGALFVVRCDRARRQVSLWREGAAGGAMTVRTSAGARSLPVTLQSEPRPYVWSALPASDRLLDQIAFSRGRFTVEVPGTPMLVIPAWPEPARVVEDCRG
jgi:hypothetical protein